MKKLIMLNLFLLIAYCSFSQTTYPIRATYNGDTVNMLTDKQMLQTVIIFTENDYNKQEIIKYKKLSAINDSIISNRDKTIDNRNSVIADKDKLIENKDKEIKSFKRLLRATKLQTYLWFAGGVAIGYVIKSLL